MKKSFVFLLIAIVSVAFMSSCQKAEGDENPVCEYTYTFALSNPETKAILASDGNGTYTEWESTDNLGVYFSSSASVVANQSASINTTSSPVAFQLTSTSALASGDKVYCYYPYYSGNDSNTAPTSVSLNISENQSGKMNSMPMVGTPYTVATAIEANTTNPVSEINMRNLAGVFQFNVFSSNESYAGETVQTVTFTADKAIAGSFMFDLSKESDLSISGYSKTAIKVSKNVEVGSDKTTAGKVYMVVAPGSYTGTLTVVTDQASYSYTVSTSKSVERSHIKPLNVDLAKGEREAGLVVPNNSFWGTEYDGSLSVTAKNFNLSGTTNDGVEIKVNNGSSTNAYVNDSQTRVYNGYTMSFTAPSGYDITDIEFTADGSNWAGTHTASVGTMVNNKTWSGESSQVTISFKGTCRVVGILVKIAEHQTINVESVILNKTSTTIKVGETETLVATVSPSTADNLNVEWSSNDETVVTVNNNGVITGIKEGTTKVVVTTVDGSYTAECDVTVSGKLETLTSQLSNANIVAAGTASTSYSDYTMTSTDGKTYLAYAIKNKHSNATSDYHYLQIKKYASNVAYYIQLPEFSGEIQSIKMTVSGSAQAMTAGSNTATLYFSASNSTAAAGTGVVSGTGASSITIDASSLELKTGYITASAAVRIWDIEVEYKN